MAFLRRLLLERHRGGALWTEVEKLRDDLIIADLEDLDPDGGTAEGAPASSAWQPGDAHEW